MLHILCVSDGHKQFAPAIDEYTKRLQKSVIISCVKPSRKDDKPSAIKEETALLLQKCAKLPKPWILLEKDGEQYSSEQFATLLGKNQQTATFLIGWPYWVDLDSLKPHLDQIISWWKQTMPHGLAFVVLLEQIWRATTILQGKTYHY